MFKVNNFSAFSVFKLLPKKIRLKKSNGIRGQSLTNVEVEDNFVMRGKKIIFLFLPDEEKIFHFTYDFF